MEDHTSQRVDRLNKYRLASGTKVTVNHMYATNASGTNPCALTLGTVVWVCYWSTWLPFACVLQLMLTFVLP